LRLVEIRLDEIRLDEIRLDEIRLDEGREESLHDRRRRRVVYRKEQVLFLS
jgi:hypothetical protein